MTHVAEYVDGLPEGLRSYPQAQCRARVVETFVGEDAQRVAACLPEALRGLVLRPPSPLSWVPEVHAQSVFAAIREGLCESDDAFVKRARYFNRRLLSSPLFSLARLVTLSRVAKTVVATWGLAHRGSPLSITPIGPSEMELQMWYPDMLFTDYMIRAYLTAAEETLNASGAQEASSTLLEMTPASFRARLRWAE
ncbi:MAG: hypothetical protein AB8H86_26215 [Polyangiales bacterium]